MTARKQPDFITIEDYPAGEEISKVKHEYLGGTVHAMAGAGHYHNLHSTEGKLKTLLREFRFQPAYTIIPP